MTGAKGGRTFWAHSDPNGLDLNSPGANWQRLSDHLRQVGELAERLAKEAGAGEHFRKRARAAGLLHDYGKYTEKFQQLLRGEVKKAPHAIYGAALAKEKANAADAAFVVAGHHAGLSDPSPLITKIAAVRDEAVALWMPATSDCPELRECFEGLTPLLASVANEGAFAADLDCRMLLSCLVDADRLDTAGHANGSKGQQAKSRHIAAAELLDRLLRTIESKASACAEGPVKTVRQEVLKGCLDAAGREGRVFSLTVPTGGGKTLAAMAFALKRAAVTGEIRRVIVVIPYLSIIEQNASVYREAFGPEAVLEHHSGVFAEDGIGDTAEPGYDHPARRAMTENWDAPVIVTTSVRFFETLFSNHPRDLRRFHNIAKSAVIVDEAQTMPRQYVKAVLGMIKGMADRWGVHFIFSTATQPALQRSTAEVANDPRWATGTVDEIMTSPARLFAALKRVQTDWRDVPISVAQAAREIATEHQALTILNTRAQAVELAEELSRVLGDVIHLSTNLCPAHRLERLAEIKKRLQEGRRCLVASTQLVEAGVDLDFPVVWRALGPLDSIAQAAGRCDREGRLTQKSGGMPGGRLVVFVPADGKMPKGVYTEGAGITGAMAASGRLDWCDPEVSTEYFNRLYSSADGLDPKRVEDLRKKLMFAQVSDAVQWIESQAKPVLVPFREEGSKLIQEIRFAGVSLGRFRRAQRYTVNLWPHQFERAKAIGSVHEVRAGVWACKEGLYDEQFGIQIEGRKGKELII